MFLIVLCFLHRTSVLSFHIYVVLTLSIEMSTLRTCIWHIPYDVNGFGFSFEFWVSQLIELAECMWYININRLSLDSLHLTWGNHWSIPQRHIKSVNRVHISCDKLYTQHNELLIPYPNILKVKRLIWLNNWVPMYITTFILFITHFSK